MKIASRILLPTLLLGATVALAQETPAPAAAPAAAPSVKTIDVSFRGTLRDALKRIAEDGGINVVATGELDTSVEVHLKGVSAPQALRTIARTYSLRLDEDGSIFTLRPMTAAEKGASEKSAAASAAAPSLPATPPVPAGPPAMVMPPMPPLPLVHPHISADDLDPSEIKERVRKEVRKAHRRSKGAKDVSVRGQSLEVKEGEAVDNAVVYGGNLVVKGTVEENAVVFGGNMDVYGTVEGDATAFGGNVILHEDAVVEGNVASMGGTVIRNEGAQVEGSTESFGGGNLGALVAGEVKNSLNKELRGRDVEEKRERDSEGGFAGFILKFAALFGLGFLGQLFFPNRMKDLSAEIKARPLKSGLTGVLGLVALVPISLVLCITLIGIPVAGVLLLVAMLVMALGVAAVASELGMKVPVLRGRKTQAVVLALGLLILLGVGSIPGLGGLVIFLATMVGFGAAIRTRFGNRPPRGIPEPLNMSSTIGV
ncbi:MAG TPA: polymer-forming cytoskeletal protein [Myxococcaceae bacterium]|jgi:cytoskeletal protein CcmA (bactofilin family)